MRTSTVLRAAKAYIKPAGMWTKGRWQAIGGACCVDGALQQVTGLRPTLRHFLRAPPEPTSYYQEALAVFEIANLIPNTVVWNDAKRRKKVDVVRALNKAIKFAEANELALASNSGPA